MLYSPSAVGAPNACWNWSSQLWSCDGAARVDCPALAVLVAWPSALRGCFGKRARPKQHATGERLVTPEGTPVPVEEFFLARGPSSSAKVRGLVIHDVKEVEGVRQQEEQEDKRDEEIGDEVNGEVEEVRRDAQHTHET